MATPPAANGTTVYVLGPTPDHGWTAQAGAYAQAKCDEITAAGEYKAVYMPASSGEEQVDQVNTIVANGDARYRCYDGAGRFRPGWPGGPAR